MHRAGPFRFLASLVLVAVLATGCGTGAETPTKSPSASIPGSPAPETDRPVETESLAPNLPGQSDTEWGPIWDAVAPSYPVPDGAKPADAAKVRATEAR